MKKIFVFVLFAFAMLFLVGCNVEDLVDKYAGQDGDSGDTNTNTDNNNNNNDDGSTVSDDHKAEEVEEKLQTLIDANGLFLRYEYHSKDNDGEEETGDIAFGADGEVYYILTGDDECYFDLSDDTKFVIYQKNEDEWTKQTIVYDEYYTKDQAQEIANAYTMMVNGFMTMYQAYEGMDAVKTSDTVAGRACDKYTTAVSTIGVAVTYTFSIDRETGACLKWDISGVSTEGSGSMSFVCKEFKTNFKITLPEATEENLED
ncbi:MAG: hypothetical protein K6E74_02800 [Bacilli bacterium]|nr:hypothetical protein [Bacilli bacterium]